MRYLVSVLLPFCITFLCTCYCEDQEKTLQLVFTIFRHGDRTNELSTTYPKDPYANETYYPFGHGQLTNEGKNRAYKLGKILRKMYDSHLGPIYTPDLINATSTDYTRTKCSLQLVLAGLFPPKYSVLEWNKELNWNPIGYNILNFGKNRLMSYPLYFCPKYSRLYYHYINTSEIIGAQDKFKPMYPYIAENTGLAVSSIFDVAGVYFALKTETTWGYPLPEWAKAVFPKYLRDASIVLYKTLIGTAELRQMFGGFLLKNIIQEMDTKLNRHLEQKMIVYSGHDMTIVSLLGSLNLYYPHIPNYSACIVIELHKMDGKPYVKVRYNKISTTQFVDMIVPGCTALCPLEDFRRLVADNLPGEGDPCIEEDDNKKVK